MQWVISFTCNGLTRPVKSSNQKLQNEKFLPTVDSNPVPFAYEANSLSVVILYLIYIEQFKVDRLLSECAFFIILYNVVDVVKCFVMITFYQLFTVSKRLN